MSRARRSKVVHCDFDRERRGALTGTSTATTSPRTVTAISSPVSCTSLTIRLASCLSCRIPTDLPACDGIRVPIVTTRVTTSWHAHRIVASGPRRLVTRQASVSRSDGAVPGLCRDRPGSRSRDAWDRAWRSRVRLARAPRLSSSKRSSGRAPHREHVARRVTPRPGDESPASIAGGSKRDTIAFTRRARCSGGTCKDGRPRIASGCRVASGRNRGFGSRRVRRRITRPEGPLDHANALVRAEDPLRHRCAGTISGNPVNAQARPAEVIVADHSSF